jgi:environmental stress-induced protein Ves
VILIDPSTWRPQPWRNGAGTTYELVREPDEPAPFDVRISVAAITASAPFSAFPGYERALYLLDGGPVALDVAGRAVVLAAPGDELRFAGDTAVAATAVGGPSRDLNFMLRAGLRWRSSVLRAPARLEGARLAVFAVTEGITAGGVALPALGCAWGMAAVDVGVAPGGIAIALAIA